MIVNSLRSLGWFSAETQMEKKLDPIDYSLLPEDPTEPIALSLPRST